MKHDEPSIGEYIVIVGLMAITALIALAFFGNNISSLLGSTMVSESEMIRQSIMRLPTRVEISGRPRAGGDVLVEIESGYWSAEPALIAAAVVCYRDGGVVFRALSPVERADPSNSSSPLRAAIGLPADLSGAACSAQAYQSYRGPDSVIGAVGFTPTR